MKIVRINRSGPFKPWDPGIDITYPEKLPMLIPYNIWVKLEDDLAKFLIDCCPGAEEQ